MIKHIVVIEDFQEWNDWYEDDEVDISKLVNPPEMHQNQGVILKGDGCKEHGLVKGDKIVRTRDYAPCGIVPRNSEQKIALALLKDHGVPLVILSGVAGSGKTLMACAHALQRLQSRDNIKKIIIAKSMTPVGREVGFLPGTMEEKVLPWLGAYYDNFVHCGIMPIQIENLISDGELEISPITYIQGRSISNAVLIIDEAQNLELNVLKQIITRASSGTQIILLGDQSQVFERIREKSLELLLEKGKDSPLVGTIHMVKCVRSPIANWAVENL